MKTLGPLSRNAPVLFLTTAVACLPCIQVAAQQALTPPAATSTSKTAGYDLEIIDGHLIRPNGKLEATLPNVVDALRDQYSEANIIMAPGLAKLKVGDLKLRAGLLAEELEAVRIASGEKFDVQGPGGPNPPMIDPNTGLPLAGPKNAGLFVLREARPTRETQRVVSAFNVGLYLEWLRHERKDADVARASEDEVLARLEEIISNAIDATRGEPQTQDRLTWQYHPGATLLVLIGNLESIEIARSILSALPGMAAVAQESRGRSGLEPGGAPQPGTLTGRDREAAAAEAAFRARYGLRPAQDPARQAPTAAPGPNPTR